ncbi:aspartyl-tRNA(Asn)/glutamyl-tRNA(Gln) amidotransferase subunit A [Klenkia marina]|uniref:Aspartyl-tRNA(Asn)/glutamyl-tRNA(Gln) amidotransferase subunit A n=1 Tax=Klenkia marina TaxID=1960309 RepID=A0A1G4XT37_9ACTN|nr:amidase [Klenkia marina]SCX44362.1 aspartyl-tRNA(Asn)/glutamyl-tRNA(Gln) amidotransferase subunit A [Klenkia marina]
MDGANSVIRRVDRPEPPAGPLSGVRLGVKDNVDVAGGPTTCASAFFASRVPDQDAEVVRRLEGAGASLVATLNLSEFAVGVTNQNSAAGPCRNPWDPSRIPGGSSGGSGAAVAAGIVDLALGTDTGGSIRLPASCCGVVGLRPTHGSIPLHGVFPVCDDVDTVGPLARTVSLVAQAQRVLTGSVSALPEPAAPRRIGIPVQLLDDVDPGVQAVVDAAVAVFGAEVVPVEVEGLLDAQDIVYTLVYADLARIHAARLASEPERFHPDSLVRIGLGRGIAPPERAAAAEARAALQARISAALDGVDLLLTSTMPVDVPRADPDDVLRVSRRLGQLTYPWSLHAGPTLALPVGFHPVSGMPVGIQLTAPEDAEDVLFAAGLWFQQQTDHHTRRPPR